MRAATRYYAGPQREINTGDNIGATRTELACCFSFVGRLVSSSALSGLSVHSAGWSVGLVVLARLSQSLSRVAGAVGIDGFALLVRLV